MSVTKKKAGGASAKSSAVKPAAKKIDSAIDLETVRELARIIGEFGLSEVEADPSGRVRVRREIGGGGGAGPVVMAPPPPIALASAPPVEGAAEAGTFITSPFVGTFYRAPSPEAANFVEA